MEGADQLQLMALVSYIEPAATWTWRRCRMVDKGVHVIVAEKLEKSRFFCYKYLQHDKWWTKTFAAKVHVTTKTTFFRLFCNLLENAVV